MRFLVFSDTHGHTAAMERAVAAQSTATHILFLGDGLRGVEQMAEWFPDRTFAAVAGNGDYDSLLPSTRLLEWGGLRIFLCHGHTLAVKSTTERVKQSALAQGASIALYGHTHVAALHYTDGLWLMNPGSIAVPRDGSAGYGVIDITDNGVVPFLVKV